MCKKLLLMVSALLFTFLLNEKAWGQCGTATNSNATWYNGVMPSNTTPALVFSGVNNKSYKEISNIQAGKTYRFSHSCRYYITICEQGLFSYDCKRPQ